jgi:hypothetical protein
MRSEVLHSLSTSGLVWRQHPELQRRLGLLGWEIPPGLGHHRLPSSGALTSAVVAARAMLRSIPANTIRCTPHSPYQ